MREMREPKISGFWGLGETVLGEPVFQLVVPNVDDMAISRAEIGLEFA